MGTSSMRCTKSPCSQKGRPAGREGEGVSECVWVLRKDEERAVRALPLTGPLADLRRLEAPVAPGPASGTHPANIAINEACVPPTWR
jgi:hypothetical protein